MPYPIEIMTTVMILDLAWAKGRFKKARPNQNTMPPKRVICTSLSRLGIVRPTSLKSFAGRVNNTNINIIHMIKGKKDQMLGLFCSDFKLNTKLLSLMIFEGFQVLTSLNLKLHSTMIKKVFV